MFKVLVRNNTEVRFASTFEPKNELHSRKYEYRLVELGF